jgi:hypothetical protein
MIENKDPFGYPIATYLWVFGVALGGGLVKYLNNDEHFSVFGLVRDLVTAGFAGILTFWLCEWTNVSGPMSAVLIATAGLMGTRALRGFESLYRGRMGMPPETESTPDLPENRTQPIPSITEQAKTEGDQP